MVDPSGTKCRAGTGASVAQVPEPGRSVRQRYRGQSGTDLPNSHRGLIPQIPEEPVIEKKKALAEYPFWGFYQGLCGGGGRI